MSSYSLNIQQQLCIKPFGLHFCHIFDKICLLSIIIISKLFHVDKLLADFKLSSVRKHLIDIKHFEPTRMHSSRMHTAHLLTIYCSAWGGICPPPSMQTPLLLEADPPLDAVPPPGRPPWMQTPLVMWLVIHVGKPPLPVNRMTNRCKNITLPQTSFARGNENANRSDIAESLRKTRPAPSLVK